MSKLNVHSSSPGPHARGGMGYPLSLSALLQPRYYQSRYHKTLLTAPSTRSPAYLRSSSSSLYLNSAMENSPSALPSNASDSDIKHQDVNVALTDDEVLAQLGYKQEFKRDFSRLELFGMSFSIVGVVQSIA